nr:HAT [Cryptomonas curvata]
MVFVFQLNCLFLKKFDNALNYSKIKNLTCLTFKCFYILRWWFLKIEEKEKKISFEVVRNDGFIRNIKILSRLQNLYSKQLPNMPIFYINRIILDVRQESIALIKCKNFKIQIIGGCSYRTFKKQQIMELVFFSIVTSEQMKGYGKILMSFLKEKAKSDSIKIIITCADNNAVKYFLKQGFSQIITSPVFTWAGNLSDYYDVKLMECLLFKTYKYYNDIPFIVTLKFLSYSKSSLIEKKRKKDLVQKYNNKNNFFSSNFFSKISKKLKKFPSLYILNSILTSIKSKKIVIPFLEPVDTKKSGAQDYFKIIFHAIDLRTIEERLRIKTYYFDFLTFKKDILQMTQNSILYNGKSHFISVNCANIQKILVTFK